MFFQELSKEEIKEIIKAKTDVLFDERSDILKEVETNLTKMAEIFDKINSRPKNIAIFPGNLKLTIRDLLKWLVRKRNFPKGVLSKLGFELFYTRTENHDGREGLAKMFNEVFDDFTYEGNLDTCIPRMFVDVENRTISNTNHPQMEIPKSLIFSEKIIKELDRSTSTFQEDFWNFCIALECSESVLLTCLLYTSPSPRDRG